MTQRLLGKRILITDFYFKGESPFVIGILNPRIYEEIVRVLSQEGAHIFALLNVSTFRDNFLKNYPQVIPILLNTFRKFETVNGVEREVNKITFKTGGEKKLMDNLPKVDHIVNFAGPEFVEVFTQKKTRHRDSFRIVNMEFGKIKSKLRSSSLIPQGHVHTIIHIIPDVPSGDGIRKTLFGSTSKDEEEKAKHYVKEAPAKEAKVQVVQDEAHNSIDDLPNSSSTDALTRLSVFRRSLSFRIRRSFATRVMGETNLPTNLAEQKLEFQDKEVQKLRQRLKEAYEKSINNYESKKKKYLKAQEQKELKIEKKVNALKESEISKNVQEAQATNVDRTGRFSQETVDRINESRTRRAEKTGITAAIRSYRTEIKRLEDRFQAQLKELNEEWYQDLLKKQAEIIRKTNKTYVEKLIAAKTVLDRRSINEM